MERITFSYHLLHPKYWVTWLAFGLWYLIIQLLPFKALMWLGAKVGRLAARFSDHRSIVARKNIAMCFPELTEQEQERLFWQSMESLGCGFMDSGIAWFWPQKRLKNIIEFQGVEHLQSVLDEGSGVLFFTYHFTSLEVALGSISLAFPRENHGVYRPHGNKVYDYVMRKGRERFAADLKGVPKDGVRQMVKALRSGKILFYLPDQDYGARYSKFVPFMGNEAATVIAPSQLAKMGRAKVLAFCTFRKRDGSGYQVKIFPAFEGYGQDEEKDAENGNRFLETLIREYPEQYLWVHRRFKSRPDNDPDFYRIKELKSYKRKVKRREKRKA